MDRYHIALFIHIVTLIAAASATAVTKLAAGRRARARTVGEVLEWHNTLTSAAKVFPLCLAAFTLTGFYMLSITHAPIWSSGFIVAGLVGVVLLLASGIFLAAKGRVFGQMLEQLAKNGADQAAPNLEPPTLVAGLPIINTGIALGVVFDMVTKPVSIPIALSVVAIGIAISAAGAMRRSAPVANGVQATG